MAHQQAQTGIASELMAELGVVVFDCDGEGRFDMIVARPKWIDRFTHAESGHEVATELIERFAFLADFIETAQAFWACRTDARINSGWWTETDNSGAECHFEAIALLRGGRRLLIIEQLGGDFHVRRDLLQKARQARLDADRRILQESNERERAQSRADELRAQLAHVGRVSAMGEMAASLAHELNQPLWAVINYVQAAMNLLAADEEPTRAREALTKAVTQAERAGGILAGLRQFIAEGAPQRIRASVAQLVEEVEELLLPDLRHAGVALMIDVPDDVPEVYVDTVQVQQVVFNLVRNAIEAMQSAELAERSIRISARPADGDRVSLTVADSGPGCDDAEMERLFDAFYSTKLGGMGMGLAIARTIVESHDGELSVERSASGGLVFGFDLPVHKIAGSSR